MGQGKKRIKDPKTSPVSVALSYDEKAKLYDLCDNLGISVSQFIRELVIAKL